MSKRKLSDKTRRFTRSLSGAKGVQKVIDQVYKISVLEISTFKRAFKATPPKKRPSGRMSGGERVKYAPMGFELIKFRESGTKHHPDGKEKKEPDQCSFFGQKAPRMTHVPCFRTVPTKK